MSARGIVCKLAPRLRWPADGKADTDAAADARTHGSNATGRGARGYVLVGRVLQSVPGWSHRGVSENQKTRGHRPNRATLLRGGLSSRYGLRKQDGTHRW